MHTILYTAGTFMVHLSLHLCEQGIDDLTLWGLAVKHAAWVYNHVPNRLLGLTPLELLTKTKDNCRDLLLSLYRVPLCLSLIPSFRTERRYPSGIIVLSSVNSSGSPICILLLLPRFETYLLVLCFLSIMWSLITYSKLCSSLGIRMQWWIRSETIFLSLIEMTMLKISLMLMEILSITLHLWMKSGWMSLRGETKETT
ncbi:hypothetical protein ACHAW6_013119 [Cyclotella cf. meneghiniana]